MEIWRVGSDTAARPKVISAHNLTVALVCHFAAFVLFWLYSVCHGLFDSHDEPKIEFFDPTVVVVENLKGNEDEPPPLKKVEPEPPPPPPPKAKPKPKPKKEEPKQLEKMVTNVVKKVEKKDERKEEKKETKKEPEKPKKTAKELREERMKKMRESAKQVNKTTVVERQPNGRTDKKTLSDAEIQKLLNMGYKPGKANQIATSENQRCLSLIREAFHSKWTPPPWTDTLRKMYLRVRLGADGRILGYDLIQSSTDRNADQTVLSAASRVKAVFGLSADFLRDNRTVRIDFEVKPQ